MKGINKYLFLLCFFGVFAPGFAYGFSANIEAIGGNTSVPVKREGKELRLKQGESLQVGDEINTDKSTAVDIRFEDQTILRLGVNSSYKITEDAKSKKLFHRFLSGIVRVLVPVKKGAAKSEVRFRMATPEATIGVRGTEFVVIRAKDETKLKGLNGEVALGAADADFDKQDSFVGVAGGFESSLKKGAKAPAKPSSFALPAYLKELEKPLDNPFGPLYSRTKAELKQRVVVAKSDSKADAKNKGQRKKVAPRFASAPLAGKKMSDIFARGQKFKANEVKRDPNLAAMEAALSGNMAEAIVAFDKQRADVNFTDSDGNSILHYAAIHGKVEFINKVLFARNAEVDIQNEAGQTPLMAVAVETGDLEVAKALIEAGADVTMEDANGFTAIDYAEAKGRKELAAYLQDALDHPKAETK